MFVLALRRILQLSLSKCSRNRCMRVINDLKCVCLECVSFDSMATVDTNHTIPYVPMAQKNSAVDYQHFRQIYMAVYPEYTYTMRCKTHRETVNDFHIFHIIDAKFYLLNRWTRDLAVRLSCSVLFRVVLCQGGWVRGHGAPTVTFTLIRHVIEIWRQRRLVYCNTGPSYIHRTCCSNN